MRLPLILGALALAACRSHVVPLDAEFRDASALLRGERFDLALNRTDDGLRRAEAGNDPDLKWRFRLLKVEILLGRRLALQALSELDEYHDPPGGSQWAEQRGHALLLRGQASYTLGRLSEASDLLSRASEAAREARSAPLSAEVQLRHGTLLAMQSHFDDARSTFQDVLDDSARLHDTYLEARAAGNLGYTLLTESRYDEAIPSFERARTLFVGLGAAESVARADGNIGACYARLGDYQNAGIYYERAQAAFDKTGNRFEQQIWLGNAGNLYLEVGDYPAAMAPYKRALKLAREIPSPVWTARWLSNLASASIGLEDWEAAEKYYNEARDLKRHLDDNRYEANSVANAALIAMGRHHLDEAERLFRQALTQQSEDPTLELEAHAGLADLFIRSGQPKKAEAQFQSAIASIDRRGATLLKDEYKLSWLGSLIRFYRLYVEFLMATDQPERALEIAESSRSHVLAGRSGGTQPAERWTPKDYERLAHQTNSTLLEFWVGQDRSYLWVITPDHIFHHTLLSKKELHPLIEHYRAVTTGGRNPLDVASETGQKLYDALLAPAVNDAPAERRFIIVPDEDLYSFNLESLPAGKDAGKFWIEQATVAIAPSLNYLAMSGRVAHPRPQARILLIGDPASAMPQYPRLEFATQEMNSIVTAMAGSESTVFKGAEARPDSYSNASPGRFGFIHFSAHAFANEINPLDSAVILSGRPDKCRLLARDVMNMPLTAELVTVSACRSAGGKTYAGEGLVGFAWSFLKAGAGNVIAGLWDVSDQSTASLMTRLYTEIAAGAPIPDALRTAKLALIHRGGAYAKPFYWAPFQLYMGRVSR